MRTLLLTALLVVSLPGTPATEGFWGLLFGCEADLPGWAATNFPVTGSGVIEVGIPFAYLGIDPGLAQNLGLAAALTDQGTGGAVFHY